MSGTRRVVDQCRLDAHCVGTACGRDILPAEQYDEVGRLMGVGLDLEGRVRRHACDRESGDGVPPTLVTEELGVREGPAVAGTGVIHDTCSYQFDTRRTSIVVCELDVAREGAKIPAAMRPRRRFQRCARTRNGSRRARWASSG